MSDEDARSSEPKTKTESHLGTRLSVADIPNADVSQRCNTTVRIILYLSLSLSLSLARSCLHSARGGKPSSGFLLSLVCGNRGQFCPAAPAAAARPCRTPTSSAPPPRPGPGGPGPCGRAEHSQSPCPSKRPSLAELCELIGLHLRVLREMSSTSLLLY